MKKLDEKYKKRKLKNYNKSVLLFNNNPMMNHLFYKATFIYLFLFASKFFWLVYLEIYITFNYHYHYYYKN